MSTTLEQPPARDPEPQRNRRALIVSLLTALLVMAAAAVVAITVWSGDEEPRRSPGNSPAPGPVTTLAPYAAPSAAPPPTPSVTPMPSQPVVVPFGYQPLWPFTDLAQVTAWQQAYRSGGHQPWHLDAETTALAFTTGYLGFTDVNLVVSRSIQRSEAWVAVGYPVENNTPSTAAVLHLARFGTSADAPWEVVGSRDTTLTITQPRYGTAVPSPLTVGGTITGVDESIQVQVRQPSTETPIGQTNGVPAGGEHTPWSTTVAYQGATAPALTIVAFTGGHYTDVERFAITGIRPAM